MTTLSYANPSSSLRASLQRSSCCCLFIFLGIEAEDRPGIFWVLDLIGTGAAEPANISNERSDPADMDAEPFEEVDPTGRYGRYGDLLGTGATKKVYRGFDQEEGIEVAWNQVRLRSFNEDPQMIERLFSEVRLLRSMRHENIIALYSVWTDSDAGTLNFITEVCTSGNLREYRKKHRHVSLKALKKWSRQILAGVDYLHNHDPCIIHRDLNCSNVFMNGNSGKLKIGDLGLAAIVGKSHSAHSILGTPEFMAPEVYEEDYTEQVDIYSFGMCVLEMVTLEIPYSECDSVAKIYRKVTAGVPPAALSRVRDSEFRAFIERCLGNPQARPSASELLCDPFFASLNAPSAGLSPPYSLSGDRARQNTLDTAASAGIASLGLAENVNDGGVARKSSVKH